MKSVYHLNKIVACIGRESSDLFGFPKPYRGFKRWGAVYLRSIGRSEEVVDDLLKRLELIPIVFEGMLNKDPRVRMRSADALEKVSAKYPSLVRHNNFAERMIRPNVIYRNRSFGNRSDRGAQAHGTMMSMRIFVKAT